MEKLQPILTTIKNLYLRFETFFSPLGNWIIDFTSLITGFSTEYSKTFLLTTLGLIIILFLFYMLNKKIKKSTIKSIENLVEIYDKIFYIIAKKQHNKKQAGQIANDNPQVKLLTSIFDSKPLPTYLNSKNLIKTNIQKLEKEFNEKILSEENRKQINSKYTSIENKKFISKIILGISLLSIGTYIYLLVK